MKFSYYIWALYLIVFPFYFLKEGDPQIADVLGALLIGLNFKPIVLAIKANRFTLLLFFFILYAFLVNTTWMLILKDALILKNSIYYLYSFLIFLFVVSKIEDHNFLKFTLKAIGISIITQIAIIPLVPDQGVRTQLFFNNPNQLALWALCTLLIVNAINAIIKPKIIYVVGLSAACTFFVILSASRSAAAGCIIFWLLFIIRKRKQLLIFAIGAVLALTSLSLAGKLKINAESFSTITYLVDRMTTSNKSDNQGLEGRGFERMFDYTEYIFFGAGEGQYERFNSTLELHSTPFNILFSYGFIGFILFILALWLIVKNFNKDVLTLFFVISLYMYVHMILRIPMFWITLLFLYYMNKSIQKEKSLELNYN